MRSLIKLANRSSDWKISQTVNWWSRKWIQIL